MSLRDQSGLASFAHLERCCRSTVVELRDVRTVRRVLVGLDTTMLSRSVRLLTITSDTVDIVFVLTVDVTILLCTRSRCHAGNRADRLEEPTNTRPYVQF